jgi:hypothetical protein
MAEPRALGVVAVIGAIVFVLIVVALTAVQWSLLQRRGWHPIRSSDVPYPSTLALGSGGWLQVLNFAVLGVALLAPAAGLWRALEPPPTFGVALLGVAGAAALALMARTDGSLSSVRTWHGAVHVGAFFTLLVSMVLALVGLAVGDLATLPGLRLPSLATAVAVVLLTILSFVVPAVGGLASVLSIAAMLAWLAVAGVALAASP